MIGWVAKGYIVRVTRCFTRRQVRPLIVAGTVFQFEPALIDRATAQVCPSPVVAANTACTVTPGSTIAVTPANAIGMAASGAAGSITANGITVNPAAANTTGALAQSGSSISFDGSTLATTATTTANSAGQIGLRATDVGSAITATGSSITMGPPNGTTTASNMIGATAESGATVTLAGTPIRMLGGGNGAANHGLVSNGAGSQIFFHGGTLSTLSRGSFGAEALNGGIITLDTGAQVSTTGVQSNVGPVVGSHALFATGSGSQITGTGITLSTSGLLASGARAENGGAISLTTSTISSSSNASADSDPSSAARALSGGSLQLNGVTINATALRGTGISVQDVGSQAIVSDTNVSVAGTRANAAFIFNGGQATFTNSDLFSANSTAVLVQDAGSTIDLTNSTIRSTGPVGYGLRVVAGGAATMSGGSVRTDGRDGPGFYAANGTIVGTNVNIVTTGTDNAMGALADLNGNITLNGGSVITSGDSVRLSSYPHGLAARNPGGILTANGTSVLTQGLVAMGAVADDGGTVFLNGNTITTLGTTSIGLYATVEQAGVQFPAAINGNGITVETFGLGAHGAVSVQHFLIAPSIITLNDSSVTTHGDLASGLRAITAGTVNANRTTVLTEGFASNGLQARDNGSSVNVDQTTVLATGANAQGALAEAGGLITGNNSAVRATGANGSGLYVAGAPGFVSVAKFTSSSITNVSGPTIGIGGNGDVSLTNSVAGGSGQWLRVGTINDFPPLTIPDAGLPGVSDPEGLEAPILFPAPAALPVVPGLANILLSGSTVTGTALTAPGSVSNLTMVNNSTWNMTGDSNITNLVNNASLIDYSPPVGGAFKTLTAVNYVGVSGRLGFNTYLGSDPSPSDKLVIDSGNASGNSFLRIRNAGGPGALTVANGILVVDTINGGTTVPGSFALAGPVAAGPYEYGLFRSSVDASNPEAWYLRSTINCALDPTHPACAAPSPEPPNFRPETSLYAAIPSMALLYGRNLLDTLHERVGEQDDERGRLGGNDPKTGWGRIIGLSGHREGDPLGIYGSGPSYNYNFVGLQTGHDVYRVERADGIRDHAGVYFAIGGAQGRVTHVTGATGDNDFTGYTLGGYWTRFAPSGWYLDAVVQGTWYDIESSAHRGLPTLKTNGVGFAGSLETGQPIRFRDGYFIEPQAQLIYQHVGLASGSDGAATVQFNNAESLTGRLGARFGRTWAVEPGATPRTVTAWIRPNLWYEFLGNPVTSFSSANGLVPFHADLGGLWGELNAGVSGQINPWLTAFANASYQSRFEGKSYAWDGKAGVRVNW